MVEYTGESGPPDEEERLARNSDEIRNATEAMLADMRAMAADRESNGYETHTIPAGDTAPVGPDSPRDYWGLSYLVPGNKTERLEEYLEVADFEETGVYQTESGGSVFVVTECIDHGSGLVLYVAGSFWMQDAPALVEAATRRGTMFSQFREIDGTHIGGIEHEDAASFFPDPDRYLAFTSNR